MFRCVDGRKQTDDADDGMRGYAGSTAPFVSCLASPHQLFELPDPVLTSLLDAPCRPMSIKREDADRRMHRRVHGPLARLDGTRPRSSPGTWMWSPTDQPSIDVPHNAKDRLLVSRGCRGGLARVPVCPCAPVSVLGQPDNKQATFLCRFLLKFSSSLQRSASPRSDRRLYAAGVPDLLFVVCLWQ